MPKQRIPGMIEARTYGPIAEQMCLPLCSRGQKGQHLELRSRRKVDVQKWYIVQIARPIQRRFVNTPKWRMCLPLCPERRNRIIWAQMEDRGGWNPAPSSTVLRQLKLGKGHLYNQVADTSAAMLNNSRLGQSGPGCKPYISCDVGVPTEFLVHKVSNSK
jgi:hypothetical protein